MQDDIYEFFLVDKKELEENAEDEGKMFCEDCHDWHLIDYNFAPCSNEVEISSHAVLMGTYKCKDFEHIWSLNGKRID